MIGFSGTRKWVYPMSVTGRFQRLRRWTFLALYIVLFVPPWITVGGHPMLRLDLENRELFAFGAIFTASDTILMLLMLLFLAFALFFFTSLFGRLWCGYACPQTVFLEAWIRPIEEWIEGNWTQRRRRDQRPWTLDKAWRKAAKWGVFALVSLVAAVAFMSYFAGARELWTGRAGPVEYALVGIFAAALVPRLRLVPGAVLHLPLPLRPVPERADRRPDAQHHVRHGARRAARRTVARQEGRCIACNKCVAVCPAGIDIRNGYQLECIACARCVDACEDVMGRLGHETLVSYSTVATAQGRPPRRLRPRTVAYGALLTGIAAVFVGMVLTRTPFEATVSRAPGSLFTRGPGRVRPEHVHPAHHQQRPGGRPAPVPREHRGSPGRHAHDAGRPPRLDRERRGSARHPAARDVRDGAHAAAAGAGRLPELRVRLAATFKSGGAIAAADPD